MRRMTKRKAFEHFTAAYRCPCGRLILPNDKIMLREDWNNYTDGLHQAGFITEWQVNNWTHPKEWR